MWDVACKLRVNQALPWKGSTAYQIPLNSQSVLGFFSHFVPITYMLSATILIQFGIIYHWIKLIGF